MDAGTPSDIVLIHCLWMTQLSRAESDQVYERYPVPAANRVLFENTGGRRP